MLDRNLKIFVAGHLGMVGSAVVRRLRTGGFTNLLLRTRAELNLLDQAAVQAFFRSQRPDYVVLAAARVGGIYANNAYPAEFIYQNLMIEANVIHEAWNAGVKKLLFLGSSCIYPKFAPQPMAEQALLTGTLESTNEPYAIAKIAGIKLCESYNRQYDTRFRSVMPTNLYGPRDNFDLQNSHVLPALIRKFHEGKVRGDKQVVVWGSGTPRREFLHVDDLADACAFVMELPDSEWSAATANECSHLNVGTGEDITVRALADLVREVVGFRGEVVFDTARPDGTPRKLLDVSRINRLGWKHRIALRDGVVATYEWFCSNVNN